MGAQKRPQGVQAAESALPNPKVRPMASFERITTWLHIVVASLVVISADYFQSAFTTLKIRRWYLVGPLLLAIVGMNLTDWLASLLIHKSRLLRRALAGDGDIEGDWVNVVIDTADDSGQPRHVELTRIRYYKGQYVVSGDTWTLDGTWKWSFASEGSRYRDHELEYFYKTGLDSVGGYGVIRFSPRDSIPTDFVCSYLDKDSKTPHLTRGCRISKNLPTRSLDERRDKALAFLADFRDRKLLEVPEAPSRSAAE